MHNSARRLLKRLRFQPKLMHVDQTSLRRDVNLTIVRHKFELTMLDEEKFSDVEIIHPEVNSLSWLHKVAPGFPINGSKINIINEPAVFYSFLLDKCRTAQRRITLASLYLGTGKLEADLVASIQENLEASNGNVKVNILLDYLRGSRGLYNSRKMLEPILKDDWKNCCDVFLYHTPKLNGLLKRIVPERFNELIGLQHMKLYILDDTLIISGANLSNDYFTNRQDRYFVIEDCKELCDFYNNLVERVGELSFRLLPNGKTIFNSKLNVHPFKSITKYFVDVATSKIQTLFQDEMDRRSELTKNERVSDADTWIFPLIEMGQLNIRHDSEVTLRLLQTASSGGTLRLATGYFNLTSEYRHALLENCQATCHLLTAHPTANGFFGAKGIAGRIPAAYSKMEESFCKACERMGQENRITLWEFIRPGWTYHAKGLWYTLPGQQRPCLTLIGSPNFGYRSVRRDLETQIAIVTENEQLQDALQKEHERLFSYAVPVTKKSLSQEGRLIPTWVCAAVTLFRYYF